MRYEHTLLIFRSDMIGWASSVTTLSVRLLIGLQSYGSEGLKLVAHEDNVSYGQAVLKLTFDPGSPEEGLLTAECRFDHPFFVKNKGKQNVFPM